MELKCMWCNCSAISMDLTLIWSSTDLRNKLSMDLANDRHKNENLLELIWIADSWLLCIWFQHTLNWFACIPISEANFRFFFACYFYRSFVNANGIDWCVGINNGQFCLHFISSIWNIFPNLTNNLDSIFSVFFTRSNHIQLQ